MTTNRIWLKFYFLLLLVIVLLALPSFLEARSKKIKIPEKVAVLIFQGSRNSLTLSKNNVSIGGRGVKHRNNTFPYDASGEAKFETKDFIAIEGNQYTGSFRVMINGGKAFLINEVPMEEYLAGVLVGEISSSWPDAAIQVQAIAARSYAYYLMIANKDKSYHLVSTTHAQVFHGTFKMDANLQKNIKQTKNVVLLYRGKPIITFFHASCGGITARAHEIWGKKEKNLIHFQNIRCHYCTTHPYYKWEYRIKKIKMMLKLKKFTRSKSANSEVNISIRKKSRSGRVQDVLLNVAGSRVFILGTELRSALGGENIRSHTFTVQQDGSDYVFKGSGFGHGVGLCQWGAKTMAEKGYNARAILRFYYKNSTIRKI